jgi:ferritin-like metal-binding protein YciE
VIEICISVERTFGAHVAGQPTLVGELDGTWDVRRVGGALPPLIGVRKRISGTRGQTLLGPVPVEFEVRGRKLEYRAPVLGVVDVVEPEGEGFRGRTLLFGQEIGQFEMRRMDVATEIEAQLIKHIDEAHAMEQNVLRMLDSMIQTADDPMVIDRLEHHRLETQGHADRMRRRLEAHGAAPSLVRQAGAIVQALVKLPLDVVRGEKAGRNARDAYATEHLEIASYELLCRIAERAGDEETAVAAREIIAEEQSMAGFVAENWDLFVAASLREAGVTVT